MMKMKVVDGPHMMAMQVERDDAAEKRWGEGLEKTLLNEHPTRNRMMRFDSFDRLAMEAQQQQLLQLQDNNASNSQTNYTRSAPAVRRDINATKSSLRLMRQVSGLGMEDPVFGTVETKTHTVLLQHPSNIFDDMALEDVPEDMRDLVSIASDPTAAGGGAANGGTGARGQGLFDTEKFHASLGADFYASISDFSLMELDLTPPTAAAAAAATTTTTTRDQQETKTVITPDSHHGRNTLKARKNEEEDEVVAIATAGTGSQLKSPFCDNNLNMSVPSLTLSNIFSSADTRKAATAATATTPSSPRGKQRATITSSSVKVNRQTYNKANSSQGASTPRHKTKTRRPLPPSFPPATAVSSPPEQQQQQQHDTLMMEAAVAAAKMDGPTTTNAGQWIHEVLNMSSGNSPRQQQQRQRQKHPTSPKPVFTSKNDRRFAGPKNSGGGFRTCKRKGSCKTTATATSTTYSSSMMNEFSMIGDVTTTTTPLSSVTTTAQQPAHHVHSHKSTHSATRRASTGSGTELATCMGGNNSININQQQQQQQQGDSAVPYQLEKPASLMSAKQRTMPQLCSLFPTRAATATATAGPPSSPFRRSARGRVSVKNNSPVNNNMRSSITSTLFTSSHIPPLFTSSHTSPPPGATSVNQILQTAK